MRFTSKQVVAMVACVCAAVVLAPVTVMAAGNLVTVVDPTNASRQAKVTSNGALMVENRAFSAATRSTRRGAGRTPAGSRSRPRPGRPGSPSPR